MSNSAVFCQEQKVQNISIRIDNNSIIDFIFCLELSSTLQITSSDMIHDLKFHWVTQHHAPGI